MAIDNPVLLSGSTNGRPIAVAATTSPGTLIHTVPTDSTGLYFTQLYLYAANIDSVSRTLTLQLGGTSTSDNVIIVVPANSIVQDVLDGDNLFNGGVSIKAYADSANKINIYGRANVITRTTQNRP